MTRRAAGRLFPPAGDRFWLLTGLHERGGPNRFDRLAVHETRVTEVTVTLPLPKERAAPVAT
jgi:hypothetical protein